MTLLVSLAVSASCFAAGAAKNFAVEEKAADELEARIAQEKMDHPKISEEFIRFWLERFRGLDVTKKDHRKMLIDTFVNAIFLYDDKMVLTFNFKEGEETIQLKDLESTLTKDNNGSDMDCSGEP